MPDRQSRGSPKTAQHRHSAAFERLARSLGVQLRRLRHEREWTIEQAAEKFQVESAHVRRMEAGAANPTLAVLLSVSRALGVSIGELLGER